VADVFLHLRVAGLVHQRQQPRADVVVQVLRDARTLFGATLFDGTVMSQHAADLLDHALGQAGIVVREQALAMAGVAQHQHLVELQAVAGAGQRHIERAAGADHARGAQAARQGQHLLRLEQVVQQPRQQRRRALGALVRLAGHAVQAFEGALGGQHADTHHARQDPAPRHHVDQQRQRRGSRSTRRAAAAGCRR
jgi:hypothetical protein